HLALLSSPTRRSSDLIRGAPRDAMLAGWATAQTRGKVYGFHRAMDHLGAVVGPLLASIFLFFFPDRYRTLFALTIVPGTIASAKDRKSTRLNSSHVAI